MNNQVSRVAKWLTRASIGLLVLGALLGIGALVRPLQASGAVSFGLALCSLAAALKIVTLYILGDPLLDLTSVLQGHDGAALEKRNHPIRYRLYHLVPLAFFTLMFAVLLKLALDGFRGQLL
jgi:hypothetical protein